MTKRRGGSKPMPWPCTPPDLICPEVGNILWKKVRRGDITADAARAIVGALPGVPLTVHPSATLLSPALDLSLSTGRTAYDSLYLSLAVALDCPIITADEKLYNALRRGPLSAYIFWVADVPAAFNRAGGDWRCRRLEWRTPKRQ
jgi:predicted nucleic acid-binding protein